MNKIFILFGRILQFISFLRFCKKGDCDSIRVTYTHAVKEEDMERFDQIISKLIESYSFITPEKYFDYLNGGEHPKGNYILMTFDDGFQSSFRAAKKILAKYGIKAIFFIPSGILDLKNEEEMLKYTVENIYYNKVDPTELVPDDYYLMNSCHIKELFADGHMICPHTHSHIFIKKIDDKDKVSDELIQPKRILEELCGTKISAFAFPVGTEKQVDKYVYEQIRQIYSYCFTALSGINYPSSDKSQLYRTNLPPDAPDSYIDMAIGGAYDSYYRLKMRLLQREIR